MASENRHNGGGTGPFNFTFPSIQQSDIKVSVNNTDLSSGFTINNYNSVSGGNVTFSSNTASGTNNVRIYRETEPETLAATFVSGSSIRAIDLNTCNKQSLFVADENTTRLNNLALGNSGSAIVISGTNIADNSITTQKILDLEVKTADLDNSAVTTAKIADLNVTSAKLATDAVTTSKIANANITGAKLAQSSVGTGMIVDGAVTQVKLDSALLAALQTTFSNPIGTVIWYAGVGGAGTPPPTGYLKANGDTIPNGTGTVQNITADFSALYALVGATLPDLRGEFIRGWDDGKGVDANRQFKSTQAELIKSHRHWISKAAGPDDLNFSGTGGSPSQEYGLFADAGNGNINDDNSYPNGRFTRLDPQTNDNGNGSLHAETRPRNVALLACIKY